jgi:hypothetical protein
MIFGKFESFAPADKGNSRNNRSSGNRPANSRPARTSSRS